MPTYKLTHFDVTGRAELARLLFAYTGTAYEDCRVTPQQWQGGLKNKMPFRLLPVLEVDDQLICDSMAIGRYLAKQFGLYGDTALDQARTDSVVSAVEEYLPVMWEDTMIFTRVENDYLIKLKQPIGEHMKKSSAPFYQKLENWLTEQAQGSDFFVGNKLTWADIHAFNLVRMTVELGESEEPLQAYPKLHAHYSRILKIDGIAKWQKAKPKEEY